MQSAACAKTAEPIEVPFGGMDSGGPKEEYVRCCVHIGAVLGEYD